MMNLKALVLCATFAAGAATYIATKGSLQFSVASVKPKQSVQDRCAVTCWREDNESMSMYLHKWMLTIHIGPFNVEKTGCAVAKVHKDAGEFNGLWYTMIDKYCDGHIEGYAGTYVTKGGKLVVEERASENEERFKKYDALFMNTKKEVLEGNVK